MWTGHDTALVIYAVLAIAVVIGLVAWLKVHAFLALMIGAIGMGLAGGLGVSKLATSFETGVGSVLGNVGLVLALGMSVPDTLKTWSVMETLISVVGMGCVMIFSLFV